MIYAKLENNKIIGFYDKEVNSSVAITEEQHQLFLRKLNTEDKDVIYSNGEWSYKARPLETVQYTYEELVEQKIRQKYTMSEELAILRQKDTKTDEFAEYFSYCEKCKAEVKNLL